MAALDKHPRLLVGETVPSVRGGTEKETLRDSQDAKDWQDAVKQIIATQVQQKARQYQEEAKPLLSTIQDSVAMFRNNKDLVPGTKEYNPVLAAEFTKLAAAYEHRVGDKLYGYRVDVQPLINSIRDRLAAAPAAPTPRQEQVAGQARAADGKFEGPQAGIPSRQSSSGTPDPDGDYSAFWASLGMSDMAL